jgi:MFS family permease
MAGTLTSSLLLPFAGTLLDRFGARTTIVAASCGLGGSLVLMGYCDVIPKLLHIDSFIALMFFMSICFLLIRFFGQGCLTMISRVAIGKWFDRHRGIAAAVSSVFVGLAFNSSPAVLNQFVRTYDWHLTYLLMAAAIGIGMTLIGWALYRDNPEECGLFMDGITPSEPHGGRGAGASETIVRDFTRREAIKTIAYWAFALGTASQALFMTAVTFHITSLGNAAGLSRQESLSVFIPIGIISVAATLVGGWASDRMRLKWILIAMLATQAAATYGLLDFASFHGRLFLILGYGISAGLFVPLLTVTWPRFFGRACLGAITGLTTSILVCASAVGPFFFSLGKDMTGTFHSSLNLCFLMPLIIAYAALKAKNPQR